ncbi:helix-turn-helix domain-containing protein [Parabacteroides sp. FAFU027]|uniref:helix-turn-helix domain-containing protein n=1 Tax=Parabacteroides sp. FAFU027 TaxID=2922715 RepID=UPI001FB01F6D|nr:XRE family transcriptional regulator [Parabacteroides sp. FAFU027]
MEEHIREIALRLKGLREVLEISVAEIASVCGINDDEYQELESGEHDIPIGILHRICHNYNVELSAMLFGDEPRMSSYYLTRKGHGPSVERSQHYKYQSLAAGFASRKADPFIVTVEPNEEPVHLNAHAGQEFDMVLEGTLLISIGGKELILDEGDSIYFDAARPHGMKALNEKPVRFLAIIL